MSSLTIWQRNKIVNDDICSPPPSFPQCSMLCLAPDQGMLSHTGRYRRFIPQSFRSPYMVEADLGFFAVNKKKYGAFFLAVQTWLRTCFVVRIPNTRAVSLIRAIESMLKVGFYCFFCCSKKN